MSGAVISGLVWLVAANVIAMLPSRDQHWRAAYGLIALGVPLLGWITYTAGPLLGLAFLLGGASVLRWPLIRLWRRVQGLAK